MRLFDLYLPSPERESASKFTAFYDTMMTHTNETFSAACCSPDRTVVEVTCGNGTSCAAQCSGRSLTLCPSGSCTQDPLDCKIAALDSGARSKRQVASVLLPLRLFSWCPARCHWVKWYPRCCLHPTCRSSQPGKCAWLENYHGKG
jgi:hypothetical protein